MRKAIIQYDVNTNYRNDLIYSNYEFLCWEDDENAKQIIKEAEDKDKELIEVEIPNTKRDNCLK